jgi:hypothetical protein
VESPAPYERGKVCTPVSNPILDSCAIRISTALRRLASIHKRLAGNNKKSTKVGIVRRTPLGTLALDNASEGRRNTARAHCEILREQGLSGRMAAARTCFFHTNAGPLFPSCRNGSNSPMAEGDLTRIIPHRGVDDNCGSFEVWFADGRKSVRFYWDNLVSRRLSPQHPHVRAGHR